MNSGQCCKKKRVQRKEWEMGDRFTQIIAPISSPAPFSKRHGAVVRSWTQINQQFCPFPNKLSRIVVVTKLR